MNQPPPTDIKHSTQIANNEKRIVKAVTRKVTDGPGGAPVVTQHFANLGSKKTVERDAARSQANNQDPDATLPVDYFNKRWPTHSGISPRWRCPLASSRITRSR